MTPSLQEYIQKHVVPARLKYKSGVRGKVDEVVRIVLLDSTPEEAKIFFNHIIDEKAKKGGA